MWSDKYKPHNYNDFVGNSDIVDRFKHFSENGIYQHLIVSGHHGTGKTTAVNLLIKNILGDKLYQSLLRISSVDEHDIQTIREKIHQFVPKKVILSNGSKTKIILFENADDTLTEGTQQVMRRIMEQHIHHAIFIFVCNHANKIIESIHSRCQTLRFGPITETEMFEHFRRICELENIEYNEHALRWISKMSDGDIRIGLNYLQSFSLSKRIDLVVVKDNTIFPYTTEIEECVGNLLDLNLKSAIHLPRKMYGQGFSALDIIMFIGNVIKYYETENKKRIIIITNIAVTYKKIVEGIDSILQVYSMFANIVKELKGTTII